MSDVVQKRFPAIATVFEMVPLVVGAYFVCSYFVCRVTLSYGGLPVLS